jgi:hypothetical protein
MGRTWSLRPAATLTTEISGTFRGPRSRVWAIIEPPETSVELYAAAVEAGRLPGRPTGVGEVQYVVFDGPNGRHLSAFEVVEHEEARRAVARSLSSPGVESTVETILEDGADGDVVLTHRFSTRFLPGAHRHLVTAWRKAQDEAASELASRLPAVLA